LFAHPKTIGERSANVLSAPLLDQNLLEEVRLMDWASGQQ
jgi:hypothetical protein